MKHLQKVKEVTVKIWYAKNGHFKAIEIFPNALEAKRFAERIARATDKELYIQISDRWNNLYEGNGLKV